MKPAITPILLLAFALPLCAEEPRTVKLTLSPETTYLMEPQLPDGRIDYIAALNKKLSAQTTPENNLIVATTALFPGERESTAVMRRLQLSDAEWKAFDGSMQFRERFFKMLGLDAPPPLESLTGIMPGFFEDTRTEILNFHSMEELAPLIEKQRERERGWSKNRLDEGKITQEEYEAEIKRIEKEIPDWYYLNIVEDMRMETLQRPWTAEEFPYFAHWLATKDDLTSKLMDISRQRTGYYHPLISDTSLGYDVLLPYIQSIREIARFFQMRGNFEFARGNFDQAMESAFPPIRIGRTVRTGSGTPVEELVGVAMISMGNYQLTRYLAELSKEKDTVWILQKKKEYDAIVAEFGLLPSPPIWYLGERVGTLSFTQTLAIEPKVARACVEPSIFDEEAVAKYENLFDSGIEYDWDEIMRQVNLFYDDFEEILLIPNWHRRIRAATRLERRTNEFSKRSIDSDDAKERKVADFLLGNLTPSIEGMMYAMARIEWDSRATSVAFALAAYRADNGGESPDSLEQLMPKYLDTIPDSPFTDKPLRYIKRRNDVLIANDDSFKLDGSEEAVEKLIAEALPGARAYPQARSYVLVVSKR